MGYACLSRWLAGLGSNELSYLVTLHCGNISRTDLVSGKQSLSAPPQTEGEVKQA